MGRVKNRRGKTSRAARKKSFRSHDPELNPNWQAGLSVGRNAAPKKSDDSVLKTVMDIKVREEKAKPSVETLDTSNSISKHSKGDRHAEMRRRGEEKRKLLAALKPVVAGTSVEDEEATVPLFTMESVNPIPAPNLVNVRKAKMKKETKLVSLFKDSDVVKSTLDPTKPMIVSKHSDHKRQKMRNHEKEMREKLRVKKEEKAEKKGFKKREAKPKFNEPLDRPSDAIKELGMKLAEKLKKESGALHKAYEMIGKTRKVVE